MNPMAISVPILKAYDALSAGLDARRKADEPQRLRAAVRTPVCRRERLSRMQNISKHQESGPACVAQEASSEATSVARGRVKIIIMLMTARTSSTKTLPSGPVVPPLINGVPTGCVAKR